MALAARLDIPVSRVYDALERKDRPIIKETRSSEGRLLSLQSNEIFDAFVLAARKKSSSKEKPANASTDISAPSDEARQEEPAPDLPPTTAPEEAPDLFS